MSTLIEKINTAFKDAYKDKNFDLKNAIGTLKGEIEREAKEIGEEEYHLVREYPLQFHTEANLLMLLKN